LIESFVTSTSSYTDYEEDLKTQSAVERQLGIIGEAINKYSSIHPEEELENSRKIVGFRTRLIHTYDAIDSSMVWTIVKRYLGPLKEEVAEKMAHNQ
jgi:uncharacterized protein with HEPN domain